MTFQIIKNAPPPAPRSPRSKYPFRNMDVGDAFDFAASDVTRISPAAFQFAKRENKKFSVRKHGDGYRCQRVA